jgi:hypothetical protein
MSGACFAFHRFTQGAAVSLTQCHQSFTPYALLVICGSYSPRPPFLFGLQTFSQATRAHFFFFFEPYHKKSLWMDLILCRIPCGVQNTDIIKVGIACKTNLVRINLPARLRDLYVQCFTRSCNLFITPSQVDILCTLSINGISKYLVGSVFRSKPRMLVKFLWIIGLVLKKKIIDLEWLISVPEASPKSSRIHL